jgi:hypothetical protein
LSELCSEEIYFWTFLNLVIWGLALMIVRNRRATEEPPVVFS